MAVRKLRNVFRASIREIRLKARVRQLESLVMRLAEHLAAASEVLSRVAERKECRARN